MTPEFILGLGAVIVVGLVIGAWLKLTAGGQRARAEADWARQQAIENVPLAGIHEVALAEGWQGPVTDPRLPRPPPELPASFPAQARQHAIQYMGRTQDSPVDSVRSLLFRVHAAVDPDRKQWGPADRGLDGGGVSFSADHPRLVNCYRAQVRGAQYLVGNCWCTLREVEDESGFGYVGSAFCAAALDRMAFPGFQVVPRGSTRRSSGTAAGHPGFDASYQVRTGAQLGAVSRAVMSRAPLLAPLAQRPPDILLGPELAAYIATRADWGFSIDLGMLVCVTLEPLQTGEQARRLISDTARAVSLLGR
jgi:hypothetical protein